MESSVKTPTVIMLALLAAAGSWVFFNGIPLQGIPSPTRPVSGFDNANPRMIVARPRPPSFAGLDRSRLSGLRIASFNLEQFGVTKASKPHVMDMLAQIFRRFDVVACQEIRSLDQSLLPALVDTINHGSGLYYDFVVGPRVGNQENLREQFAFVFNAQTVEVDRSQLYTIDDPDELLNREPFVGWFRARGPSTEEAFTFTLVNVHTDTQHADEENGLLPGLVRLVQSDGRQEDDVIVVGDFNASSRHLESTLNGTDVTWVVASSVPTNIEGTDQFDNIGFVKTFTDEFTGRGGALDFLREFNLNVTSAAEVSNHLPVWAEFTVFEGGTAGRVATLPIESETK